MKKIKMISILSVTCILCILFIVRQDIGAGINDKYKQTLLEQYFSEEKTVGLNVLESATFCGNEKTTNEFIIWVGAAVQSSQSREQLAEWLDKRYGSSLNLECIPYDAEFANRHGFTGIQKELAGKKSTKGYYIIGITFEPKTSNDSRNNQ